MIDEIFGNGVLQHLSGLENNYKDGTGVFFNFILSNGDRTAQSDKSMTYYDHMFPKGSHKRIRSVDIYYYGCICGFHFYDKERALLLRIGDTNTRHLKVETVVLADNEVIVGVVAKPRLILQSRYTHFQFQIGDRWE